MGKQLKREELTKEQLEKAMACKTTDELMAVAKAEGYDITVEEAEAYLAEMADVELDEETLAKAAGGDCYTHCYDRTCKLKDKCSNLCPIAAT